MQQIAFHQPDAAAMTRLLERHALDTAGVVLRLAWLAGLTRREIYDLTWEQADLDAGLLRLPDREVPLEGDAAACLERRRETFGALSPYVAASGTRRDRLALESISRLARRALDEEGMAEVRLQDLREDFVRRQLARYDWPYALRVSGLSVTTYRGGLAQLAGPSAAEPGPQDGVGDDFKLWRVLQTERDTPAGIALWLSYQLGLRSGEIADLTWDRVDFAENAVRLPGRDVALTVSVRRVLEEARARRFPWDDPHVILSPRARKPVTTARLSTMARAALVRGGIDGLTLGSLRGAAGKQL